MGSDIKYELLTMTKDEKLLIDEKFHGLASLINARFENVEDRLERIEGQTTKTNGRVSALEEKELTHIITCPNVPKIEKINEELAEYKMFKKYPKMGLAIIAAAVIMFLITTFNSVEKVKQTNTPENREIIKEAGRSVADTLQLFE
jgi:hypothetical protein